MPTRTRSWRLVRRPEGEFKDGDLELVTEDLPDLADGQVLVRTLYLSLDPTNRIWMSDMDQYMPPVEIGAVMRGVTLGEVVESRAEGIQRGDLVQGVWGWTDHAIIGDARQLRNRLPRDGAVPLPAWLHVLGSTGITAYFGLKDVGRPNPGETLVVSAAAGAVGSIAGQIGKILGLRVVGIAGSAEKCRWITETLGFDGAVNYRTQDVSARLAQLCPGGIDVIFENVGGAVLDAALKHINIGARVALCGLISQYNQTGTWEGPRQFQQILMKRAHVQGFIVTDFLPRFREARDQLAAWLAEGRLQYQVDIVEGLERAPSALSRLFDGSNTGKLMVRVAPEPGG